MEKVVPKNRSVENQNENYGGVNAPLQQLIVQWETFTELCSNDLVGKLFEIMEAANKFYYAYAHAIGFLSFYVVLLLVIWPYLLNETAKCYNDAYE